jgi:U3 small nucleolar RNA-associated protein 10
MLSFWSGITIEAIYGIVSNSSSGRKDLQDQGTEKLVLELLPVLNSCMRAKHGADTVLACYAVVIMLVSQAKVGDKVLDGLMEAVIAAHDETYLQSCLGCLAIISIERSKAQIPAKVSRKLLKVPQLLQKLTAVSQQCQVERLLLGCALGALGDISDENRDLFHDLIASSLLSTSCIQMVLSALVQLLHDSAPGSEEHGELLQVATKMAESKELQSKLQEAAKQNNVDLETLGLSVGQSFDIADIPAEDSDEEMLDADEDTAEKPVIQLPEITTKSFLEAGSESEFAQAADIFEQAVATKQTRQVLVSDALHQESALKQPLYLSFLARVWSSIRPVPVRIAALRAAASSFEKIEAAHILQNILPYLVHALADASPLVRRSAAVCVGSLARKASAKSKAQSWGKSDLYGKESKELSELKPEEVLVFVSSMLQPILEECVMDSKFVIPALRDVLEGTQLKNHSKNTFKMQTRTSVLGFFASHAKVTPVLRVRLSLLPMLNIRGKVSDNVRSNFVIPLLTEWSTFPTPTVTTSCNNEGCSLDEVERAHIAATMPREAKSADLLRDIISGTHTRDREVLVKAAFDRIHTSWSSFRSEARHMLAQSMLSLSTSEGNDSFDKLSREQSIEILRNVDLDSAILVTFLESVPSPTAMPEGPPAAKRRRTSRSEMARVELSSQDDVQRLLRKLTLVLELVEGSNPGQHPTLFKNLFGIFAELQPLKQQSGSELVYLQSIILGSLSPIVNTLKEQTDTADYQSAVRADLLIDCIRHSSSPQVQNSALLLISNLASWVPDLILHNLMPIFTFIGSTLLRQHDDYSAQVVDKTISRVVPQLAASLRSKHRDFIAGVSDLLLSFTAAFEHIPLHRRMKLFTELARTLGPEDSLPAIVALLADRYHSKEQRRFCADLLLHFEPVHTLVTFKGYVDLLTDAVGPKPQVAETLFGLKEKTKENKFDLSIQSMLSCLTDLALDDKVKAHVTRAYRKKDDPERPRKIFANIVETTIQLSKKVATNPKTYAGCSRVLASCLDLLPTTDLIKSAQLLLSSTDSHVQVAAVKSVELRAGTAKQNDHKSVEALISFLPSVQDLLEQSSEMDAKMVSVSCIDRIIERFGKKDVSAVASVAQIVSGSQSLSSSDDRLRVLSLLCLTSVVDVLEDEAISLLPTILPTAFEYLSHAIEDEKTGLHNAVFTILSNIVERLGYMFSRDYLDTALRLCQRSAAADLDQTCDESRSSFFQSVSEHLGAQEVFAAIKSTWPHAASQGFDASLEQLELLRATVNTQTKAKLVKASPPLFSLLLQMFRLRETVQSSTVKVDDEEIEQLESTLIDSVIAMVLKLSDATFRPFFVQLVDKEGPLSTKPERAITFYKFLAAFFDKFKVCNKISYDIGLLLTYAQSLVTSYSSYIIEHAAKMLTELAKEDSDVTTRSAVLDTLQKTFQHDQDGFWQAPSHFGTIMPPLMSLLNLPSASTSTPENNTNNVIPTITELAVASASSMENHREMNSILLKNMRSDDRNTRLATVLCEQSLTRRLGEEWLGLLPEMLPFISELMEDDDEIVERECQRWKNGMEEILGESLEGMLQ